MAKRKLTETQDAVLQFLYERRDEDSPPNTQQISAGTGLSEQAVRQTLAELKEMKMVSGPPSLAEEAARALGEMEPKFKPTDSGYAEHILLLASMMSKADESFLASELGYDREFTSIVGARLRAAGIWNGSAIEPSVERRWTEDGFSFFLDAAVACGALKIVGGTAENPQYQMTEVGLKDAAAMIKGIKRRGAA